MQVGSAGIDFGSPYARCASASPAAKEATTGFSGILLSFRTDAGGYAEVDKRYLI